MEKDVIDQIKSSNTKMRPRWYFIFRAVLLTLAVILLFLLILFFVSFVIFALRADGGLLAASYGFNGWDVFFHALPWTLILLSLILILGLIFLLKRYEFVYHQPFLYPLLGLIIVVALASFFLSATSLHPGIFSYASHNDMPLVEGMYQFEMNPPPDGIYRGEVIAVAPGSFVLQEDNGQTSTVLIASNTFPGGINDFSVGDYVMIFGHPAFTTATIEVFSIQRTGDY